MADFCNKRRAGIGPRIGLVEAVLIGQQHKAIGTNHDRDLRRQKIVVAERDLLGRRRVVLVDDRHNTPLE